MSGDFDASFHPGQHRESGAGLIVIPKTFDGIFDVLYVPWPGESPSATSAGLLKDTLKLL